MYGCSFSVLILSNHGTSDRIKEDQSVQPELDASLPILEE